MHHYVALLRGINVGGNRIIKMDNLKKLFIELNLNNPETYIQSGNVLFSSLNEDVPELEISIEKAIKDKFQFDVPVIVLSSQELESCIEGNPYMTDVDNTEGLHVTYLQNQPTKKDIHKAIEAYAGDEQFKVKDRWVYLNCDEKYHKSKLSIQFFQKHLNTQASNRNWKTTLKLMDLLKNRN